MYYAEASNWLAGPISVALRLWAKELFLRNAAIGNTVSDLTGARFELQISRWRGKHVTAWPTGVVVK